ncbi:hypothetical protein [uncultured Tateyamaria sp.]|uniref:hypothetical protein n=1 Tax=uncultured Tateyamaria sp. TaxID=455651 RepID=UPI002614F608|nr:hypothetical protein [uncultured Tateyamaria sp.]
MKMMTTGLVFAALLGASAVWASDSPKPVQQHNSNAVWFENWTGLSNTSMVISKPDGELATVFAATGTPVFQLTGTEVVDGIYRYELTAATDKTEKVSGGLNNGRGSAAKDEVAVPFYMNGHFTVSRGVIVTPEDLKEE